MKQTVTLAGILLAFAISLASCGGNSKSESNTTSADNMQREEVNFNPEGIKQNVIIPTLMRVRW